MSGALAANRRGIVAMSLGMVSFVANDALIKLVSASLPSGQLIFIRGLFAIALLLALCTAMGVWRSGNGWRALGQRAVLVRAGFDALATIAYLTSLFHLPLGNATAINMATPLVITLMAVLWLGERVGPARWVAIGAGFVGVLMIVQPSAEGFNAYAWLCLAGTLLHAARDLVTRRIASSTPSLLITLSTALAVTLLAAAISMAQGWVAVGFTQLALLAVASVFLSTGYYLLIVAMRAGEISVIAPFRYVGLLFALVLGWLVWRELPNALAWAGIALLVGAGLYVLHEQRAGAG
ncbi:MAG: DMT family transporter [Burkholderiaceae bacterium]